MRRVPEKVDISRLVAQLDNIRTLGRHHADAQHFILQDDQPMPAPSVLRHAAPEMALRVVVHTALLLTSPRDASAGKKNRRRVLEAESERLQSPARQGQRAK